MALYAPIILFVYNRPNHTRQTLEALAANTLAQESALFIYADGAKDDASPEQFEKIKQTRAVAREKQWCKTVTVIEAEKNKGLAASIISGVTEIVNTYGAVIVLEDDIVTGNYFLEFMNSALEKYKDEKKLMHITGWRDPVQNAVAGSCYIYPTMDCWGWATWADRWQFFKKDTAYYQSQFTEEMKYHFNIEGSDKGMWSQIEDNASGKLNTWAIFWYAAIFLKGGLCLAPTQSLVKNIGFDNSGEHCGENLYQTIVKSIDTRVTDFPAEIKIDEAEYNKNVQFLNHMYGNTLWGRTKRGVAKMVKFPFRPLWRLLKRMRNRKGAYR
ncbi:MAG: glycosyltransferase [Treponema sp.]|nr:glycosyltransferase [Treponema sp.]